MKHIILVIKGFFIGIALIIPGLSGGTLAVYLGIYEKLLHAIGNIFVEFKNSIRFLIPVFFGMGISVISLAKLFGYLINMNSFVVLFFFIGLIVGGINGIYQRANEDGKPLDKISVVTLVLSFSLVMLLIIFGKLSNNTGIATIEINFLNIILLFVLGMVASMTMIIPGISGSALLIVLGYYTAIVTNVVGNILDFSQLGYHLQVIIPFGLGAATGIIVFSKIIGQALLKFTKQSYFAILGFILGSVVAIFFEIKDPNTGATHDVQTGIYVNLFDYLKDNIWTVVIGLIVFVGGIFLAKYLSKFEVKKNIETT